MVQTRGNPPSRDVIPYGSQRLFEYHCEESHSSAHAELWYRSQSGHVLVLHPVNPEYAHIPFIERCDAGCQLVYRVIFKDGYIHEAFEDELLHCMSEYSRTPPPRRKLHE